MCKDPRKCPSSLSLKLKDEKTYTSVALSIGPWKKENYEYLKEKTLFLRRRSMNCIYALLPLELQAF